MITLWCDPVLQCRDSLFPVRRETEALRYDTGKESDRTAMYTFDRGPQYIQQVSQHFCPRKLSTPASVFPLVTHERHAAQMLSCHAIVVCTTGGLSPGSASVASSRCAQLACLQRPRYRLCLSPSGRAPSSTHRNRIVGTPDTCF